MRLLIVAIILLGLQSCKKESTINASSIETFEASKNEISNNLSEAEKLEFNKAINIIKVGSKRIKSEQTEKYGNMTDQEVALSILNGTKVNDIKIIAEEQLKKQKEIDIKTINNELEFLKELEKILTESNNIDKNTSQELEYEKNRLKNELENIHKKSDKISDWKMVDL